MDHPSKADFVKLLSGQSSDSEAESLLSHVEVCPDCESVIVDLENASTEMIDRIRQPLDEDPYVQEEDCGRFLSQAESLSSQEPIESPAAPAEGDVLPEMPEDNIYVTSPASLTSEEKPVPLQIGRYQIQRQLGRGGFGVVLLAMDQELNRLVAIKLPLYGRFKSENEIQQFVREARTSAGLKHPGIVTVYDVGRQDDGTPFVVMEYIEGKTLKDLLENERLTSRRIAELMIPITEALGVAHQQGFVHRDLKPENILIDSDGKPHVADFGLAVHESDQRFRAGEFSGTPCYMAPEQIRGEVHRLDGRADIWALGTVLYEMLTGRRAFGGDNFRQVADEILHRLPKPPRQIDGDISPELQRICLRCCEKEISDRYSSAADICQELRAFLDSSQGSAAINRSLPESQNGRFRSWGAKVAVGAAVLIIVAVWFRPWGKNDPPAEAVLGDSPEPESVVSQDDPATEHTIDVLVWDPSDRQRRGLRLQDQGALPLRTDDRIRVEAKLGTASYAYIVWIDSEGVPFPVYPWEPGDWSYRPAEEKPTRYVSLPKRADGGWPMGGAAGMETLLLLVRATPLPPNVDLKQMLADLPQQPYQNPASLVWFVDGEVLMGERDRAPRFFELKRIDDQVLKAQRRIHESLMPHFDAIRAVSFANRGT